MFIFWIWGDFVKIWEMVGWTRWMFIHVHAQPPCLILCLDEKSKLSYFYGGHTREKREGTWGNREKENGKMIFHVRSTLSLTSLWSHPLLMRGYKFANSLAQWCDLITCWLGSCMCSFDHAMFPSHIHLLIYWHLIMRLRLS